MKIAPLGDRVVLKQLEAEETTVSGIVIPGKEKELPQQAEVIEVGPGVIYSKYAGTEVEVEGEKVIIVRQADILAVLK